MNLLSLFRRTPKESPEQRLERIVRDAYDSYEVRRYRERRAAAKLGHARKQGMA